ncbi:MAG: hypothetical protein PHE71_01490 [Candidatus Shapirobacteria bacterium]|nr:hypothetical protein [Candidatus Shapirobacteria bacterium]
MEEKSDDKIEPSFLEVYCQLGFFIKECSVAPSSFIASIRIKIEHTQDPTEMMEVIKKYKSVLEEIKKTYVKEKI